jgi:hypothetical protein
MGFPFETDETVAVEETVTVPREYGIDFDTGQLTGKMVEGAEAIKAWIYNVLRTQRYRFNIFSWDYGNELEDLIGQSYTQEYLNVEAKRMVEDCLSVNEYITSIDNFSVDLIDDKLSISFTANTLFGEVKVNV